MDIEKEGEDSNGLSNHSENVQKGDDENKLEQEK